MRLAVLLLATSLGFVACNPGKDDSTPVDDTGPGVNLDDQDNDGVDAGTDCDDTDPSIGGPTTGYTDADGDGHGAGDAITACESAFVVESSDDCDDTDAAVFPGAAELCNGVDDDCDGDADDGATGSNTWYADTDGDGYGDPAATSDACEAPAGSVADSTDCDDTNGG